MFALRTFIALFMLMISAAFARAYHHDIWNREWEFRFEDAPLKGDWHWVHLPHSFSMPYFMSDTFYTGRGTYRKTLNVKPEWLGKKVYLDFEAAFQVAVVKVNGKFVTRHEGGYTAFRADLSPHLIKGANTVEVTVDNRWNPRIAPRAGEHTFSGGLYRNVYLHVCEPVHIPHYGVWVKDMADKNNMLVETQVVNESRQAQKISVFHMMGVNGGWSNQLEFRSELITLQPGERRTVAMRVAMAFPHKTWNPNPENAGYWIMTTELQNENGECLDRAWSPIGCRTLSLTVDKGLLINGKSVYLRGANVHQDHAGWGDAVTDSAAARDVAMMREAGFNFIRCSHYPHSQAFMYACDRLGMAVMCEGIFWGMGGFKENDTYWNCDAYPPAPADRAAFEASCMRQVREMVIQNRNHPCIVAWSISNEPFFTRHAAEAKALCEKLIKLVKELDPSRPVCVGGGQRGGFDKLGDFAAFNGDGAHFKTPGRPSMVSEYGSVSCKRPGEFAAGWGDLNKDEAGGGVFPWRFGEAVWCGFAPGSIWQSGARMGIVDYFRVPKRSWYWYRKEYAGIDPPDWPVKGTPAMLQLTAGNSHAVFKNTIFACQGTEDLLLTVTVADAAGKHIANEVPVTLSVVAGPGEFPTGKSITFTPGTDIDLIEGCAAIEFRSYYSGKTLIRATSPGLKPAELTIECACGPEYVPGKSKDPVNRPYQRFTGRIPNAEPANLATLRPCSVSSNRPDAALAADGNPATAWTPAKTDPNPFWQLDMEFEFPITHIRPQGDFKEQPPLIQTSLDGKNWSDWTGLARARYVRLRLHPGQSLSEVTVR